MIKHFGKAAGGTSCFPLKVSVTLLTTGSASVFSLTIIESAGTFDQ